MLNPESRRERVEDLPPTTFYGPSQPDKKKGVLEGNKFWVIRVSALFLSSFPLGGVGSRREVFWRRWAVEPMAPTQVCIDSLNYGSKGP
jgi:hypothetical protein